MTPTANSYKQYAGNLILFHVYETIICKCIYKIAIDSSRATSKHQETTKIRSPKEKAFIKTRKSTTTMQGILQQIASKTKKGTHHCEKVGPSDYESACSCP